MKVLIIGREAHAEAVECQLVMAGYVSGHVSDVLRAVMLLRRGSIFDLIVIVDHQGLETIDATVEELRRAARAGGLIALPYIFAVEDGASESERAKPKVVDAVLEEFSVRGVRGSVCESKGTCVLNAKGA